MKMKLNAVIKRIEELKQELIGLRPIDADREQKVMQKFRLDWNYHSNKIEGNSLSYGETKALLLFGITAQGKPLKDHLEIQGHNEAVKYLLEIIKQERPLTENFIRELHTIILKEPYEVDAITPDGKPTKRLIKIGQYKSVPNHVLTKTGEIFRFASPEETPALMMDLIDWYKNSKDKNHAFWIAAEFHYKFIRIHPFDDGNGRLARILMNFILMQNEFPPVVIKTEEKVNYFRALELADSGDLSAFFSFIGSELVRSLDLIIRGAKGENIEEPDDLDKQIALLQKRVELLQNTDDSAGALIGLQKEIFIQSIFPFTKAIVDVFKKFDNLFFEARFSIRSKGTYYGKDFKLLEETIKNYSNFLDFFEVNYKLENLKAKKEDYTLSTTVKISFEKTKYVVKLPQSSIEKFYPALLSEEDLTKAKSEVGNFILKSIENAIQTKS